MPEATITAPAHRSPFEGHAPGDKPSRDGKIGVRLHADTLPGVLLIATWPAAIADLEAALARALDASVPAATGLTAQCADGVLLRTGPEEFMLLCADATQRLARLRNTIAADVGSVTDLGHARCRIRIEGERCRATLSKLFALDLRDPAFPLGQVRLSGHHHVPCTLHRIDVDRFDLYVFTTYAYDQLATLLDAAREFGVALELGAATGV